MKVKNAWSFLVNCGYWWEYYKLYQNSLTFYNGKSPYIYGLPKVHTEDISLRTIISNIGSPKYYLSKFVSDPISKMLGINTPSQRFLWFP